MVGQDIIYVASPTPAAVESGPRSSLLWIMADYLGELGRNWHTEAHVDSLMRLVFLEDVPRSSYPWGLTP